MKVSTVETIARRVINVSWRGEKMKLFNIVKSD
jgi:hypothetical protein